MLKTLIYIFLSLSFSLNYIVAQTKTEKIENPIYPVFNLDDLSPFSPGGTINSIPKTFGVGEDVKLDKALEIKKFYITHNAYKFPIWVQYFNKTIIDFYTRLPSYFLHDTFHQSLINRYGKQNIYALKDSTAVYTWENDSTKRVYSGGCTITCYPIYYAVINKTPGKIPTTYRSLADHFVRTGF